MCSNAKPEPGIFFAQSFAFSSSLLKLSFQNIVAVHFFAPVREEACFQFIVLAPMLTPARLPRQGLYNSTTNGSSQFDLLQQLESWAALLKLCPRSRPV